MQENNKLIFLKNIRVVDPFQNIDQEMNIIIKNEIISYFENSSKKIELNENEFQSIDCKNKILCPGLFDLRVYLDETNDENVSLLRNIALKSGYYID